MRLQKLKNKYYYQYFMLMINNKFKNIWKIIKKLRIHQYSIRVPKYIYINVYFNNYFAYIHICAYMQICIHICKNIYVYFCRQQTQAQNGQIGLKHFIIIMELSIDKLIKACRGHLQLYSSVFLSVLKHCLSWEA